MKHTKGKTQSDIKLNEKNGCFTVCGPGKYWALKPTMWECPATVSFTSHAEMSLCVSLTLRTPPPPPPADFSVLVSILIMLGS